jgi:hypothetical protein
MNKKKLFTKLNKLCLKLDEELNINSGGCCFVAAVIAEQLEIFNIPFEIIYYNCGGCHYAIKVSDRYINRGGYYKKEIDRYSEISSSDELFDIYNDNDWNETYNTLNNDYVYKKIKELFVNENNRT